MTLMTLMIIATVSTATIIFPYDSIGEWWLHGNMMHKPLWGFRYPFERHALTHHRLFRSDPTYHLQEDVDKRKIRMAWWNGAVIILIGTLPFAGISTAFVLYGLWQVGAVIYGTTLLCSAAYYGMYEYMHWCFHLPKERRLERWWLFQRMNGHHILHHRFHNMNLNVVFPFADWLFGTLLRRSPIKFRQVLGPSVPDLQPLAA